MAALTGTLTTTVGGQSVNVGLAGIFSGSVESDGSFSGDLEADLSPPIPLASVDGTLDGTLYGYGPAAAVHVIGGTGINGTRFTGTVSGRALVSATAAPTGAKQTTTMAPRGPSGANLTAPAPTTPSSSTSNAALVVGGIGVVGLIAMLAVYEPPRRRRRKRRR